MADDNFTNIKIQFEQFLSTVGYVLSHDKQIDLIKKNLHRRFKNATSSYLLSTDFQSLLTRIHCLFNSNNKSTKFFKILNLLNEELKKNNDNSTRSKEASNESIHSIEISLQESPSLLATDDHVTSVPIVNKISDFHEQMSSNSTDVSTLTTTEQSRLIISSVPRIDAETKRKEKIARLEHRLSRLAKLIQQLEKKELSLDEMIYSDLYHVEAKLKKQAYELYIKINDLKNQSLSLDRILDQPICLTDEEIDHPFINKALEDMVNQSRFLPSFHDVINVVEKTNNKYELALSVDAQKTIAEKAFKIIGVKIKNRRMADFLDIMKSRLPEDFDIEQHDPALNDIEIEKKLVENEREAERKTQEIFEEFSQMDPYAQSEINIESSDELTVESSDEDDEDRKEEDEATSSDSESAQFDATDIIIIPSPESPALPSTSLPKQENYEHLSAANTSRPMLRSRSQQIRNINGSSTIPKRPLHDSDSSRSKKRLHIMEVTLSD